MINAEQVREEMRRQELSQKQLAGMAKVSQTIISQWLSGKAEPSDITKTRVAMALDLLPAAPAADPDADLYATKEDEAAAEIMAALNESAAPEPADTTPATPDTTPDPTPAPAPTTERPDPAPAPAAPEPGPEPRAASPAELIYLLTRLPGCYFYEDREGPVLVLPRDSDLERFARNLDVLDTMLQMSDIDADAHLIATASLLGAYKRRETEGNA